MKEVGDSRLCDTQQRRNLHPVCGNLAIKSLENLTDQDQMKSRLENKVNWVSGKATKSRELVYKLIDINKEIDGNGKTFRVGDKVYFVR